MKLKFKNSIYKFLKILFCILIFVNIFLYFNSKKTEDLNPDLLREKLNKSSNLLKLYSDFASDSASDSESLLTSNATSANKRSKSSYDKKNFNTLKKNNDLALPLNHFKSPPDQLSNALLKDLSNFKSSSNLESKNLEKNNSTSNQLENDLNRFTIFIYETEEESKLLNSFSNQSSNQSKNQSVNQSSFHICKSTSKSSKPNLLQENYDRTVLRRHPNLPLFLLGSSKLSEIIPQVTNIRWSGTLYQESWSESPKCHLFSANFDSRMKTGLIVRILSLCEDNTIEINFFCQFWFNLTGNPIASPVYEAGFPGHFTNNRMKLKPMLMSCKVPLLENQTGFPVTVSIVKKPCSRSTNILKIGGSPYKKIEQKSNKTKKNLKIGLCGKAIYYYNTDFSDRLIEWIEVYRILGISKFFLYKTPCHKNVEKVLDYYEKKGIVKIMSFHYPSPYVQEGTFIRLWTKIHYMEFNAGQRMFYNDCMLRNKDDYDYLAIFDYDELPILRKHKTLVELLQHLRETNSEVFEVAAVSLRWKNFYSNKDFYPKSSNVSDKLYAMKHNRRSSLKITQKGETNVKSIYNTDRVLYVACHHPLLHKAVPPISDKNLILDRELAYTGHFNALICRSSCKNISIEKDETLLQFHDQVFAKMKKVWKEIHGRKLKN